MTAVNIGEPELRLPRIPPFDLPTDGRAPLGGILGLYTRSVADPWPDLPTRDLMVYYP
jgi:hypothetical protein